MTSQGETDLSVLLRTMQPIMHPAKFLYCTLSPPSTSTQDDYSLPPLPSLPPTLEVHSLIRESEGWTLITTESSLAQHVHELTATYASVREEHETGPRWRMITLNVHSSLQAVGFIAEIAKYLGQARISCNVVAGFLHDHVFVPAERADDAMRVLRELGQKAEGA